MKVLLVHNYYRSSAPSGEDAVARNERELLEANGVTVIRYERFNDDLEGLTPWGKLRLALDTVWSRRTYRELSALLREQRPDLVHVHSVYPQVSPSVYSACNNQGVPVLHTLHNYRFVCPGALLQRNGRPCEDCLGRWPWRALLHRCFRGSLAGTSVLVAMIGRLRLRRVLSRQVDRFIAITEFAKSRLAAGGIPAGLIEVKPNFLPEAPQSVRAERGEYAVYVGRLTEEKGVQTLIEAWQAVPGLGLKVVGAGALRPRLEAQARTLGVDVQFLGAQDRAGVLEVVGRARFLVVPSQWYETFGMVAIEAYSCGTPVLVSRLGALAEVVVEGETGLSFEAGNAADLARQARLLAGDPELTRRMGEKARQLYLEKYTPEHNVLMLLDIYRRTCETFKYRTGA